jgi:ribosomal-protein-alanine N-acetyltransferase
MCETIILRRANEVDLEHVLRIEQESATAAHWAIATYRAMLSADTGAQPRRVLLVADLNGEIVGFAAAQALSISGHAAECELENIAVSLSARGAGIATAMLQRVCDWARTQGSTELSAEVRQTNTAALHLYVAAGFEKTSQRKKYYTNPDEDAQVLTLHL